MKISIGNEKWRDLLERTDEAVDAAAVSARLDSLAETGREFGFDARDLADLRRETDLIRADAELLCFWERVRRIVNGPDGFRMACEDMRAEGGADFHLFAIYLTEVLACVPEMRRRYDVSGWPKDMISLGLRDMKIWMDHTRENYGVFGLSWTAYPWLHATLNGAVIRPGRLQCNTHAEFPALFRVYRNRRDEGRFAAFYAAEQDCCELGYPALAGEKIAFRTAPLAEADGFVRGHLCGGDGRIDRAKTSLDLTEWEEILKGGDAVINLHIPADGPLDTDACRAVMARMKTIFRDYIGTDVKALICESWLLDPQFPAILPEDSNLVRFQRLGHILPYIGCADTVMRVYGVKARDGGSIDAWPLRTGLQRRLAAFSRSGGRFRNGFFYIPL